MQMREAAERILFADSLDEKLTLAPEVANDDEPGMAIVEPDTPGRPDSLRISQKGVKASFPGVNRMDDDRERGVMMHFLANHELMAAELMALVLLKFPDAPKAYREGVYEAMREEQMHTLMYMRRMRECGIHFGDLPVNDYFWKLIAPMETPMDFVTRLNLTFEQSNLDFSKHYAGLFRQVGDTGTAAVLEKIYQDEIGHVGHGVKWFRKWKHQSDSDWQAFKKSLSFPLAPAKAKGMAPFNVEGRRLAGLDDDFIAHLEVCEQSRGRTPVVHWFNPNAESAVAASLTGDVFQPNKMESAMEQDLEILSIAWCRRDDLSLMRCVPGNQHLAKLKQFGFDLPEIVSLERVEDAMAERKLGGLRPWAWSPDATRILDPFADAVSESGEWKWRREAPAWWLAKEAGVRLNECLGLHDDVGAFFTEYDSALLAVQNMRQDRDLLLKSNFSCAGRGHFRVRKETSDAEIERWLKRCLAKHAGVLVEPWLDRVMDFSALYEMGADGQVRQIGLTEMQNDRAGRFLGSRVYPKWGGGIDPDVAKFLFADAGMMDWYRNKIPAALSGLLGDYRGPVGVDAMVYRDDDGALALRHVVELNVRMTMGRVALELQKKSKPGSGGLFRILRKSGMDAETLHDISHAGVESGLCLINDPENAREFLAVWEVI
ncbi:DUF455 family protein [Verrucomicrobiaceae bacterium N1E253]|uniref:DUF455 family protein n=1 Tax=Oceaniferula marina TaxID=2748318 RepID=A0A851GAS2_9BACT|nr:DUF455 family protein [Oceaniferula marina]NWK54713.1 DUF455 family protein [Oceaniferula marina]